jgi:hypothetical protein
MAGVTLPVCASILSISGLPAGIKCVTGYIGFTILGWMITAVFTPIIGFTVYLIYRKKFKMNLG